MNLFTRLTTTGALLLAPALFAADAFEGKVTMAMTGSNGETHTLSYEMKGPVMRMDPEGGQASIIMDMGKHQMITLLHQQRMFMIRPMQPPSAQAQNQGSPQGGPPAEHSSGDMQPTGKTEKILGYTCTQFIIKDGEKTTEMWLASGLGMFMGMGGGGNPFGGHGRGSAAVPSKWEALLKGGAVFPMRVVTHDASGRVTERMEVTKIEQGGVSDEDFAPPPGYRPLQIPNMPGMNPYGGG